MITTDGMDVGWIQQHLDHDGIFLGSISVVPMMQRKGVGTPVIPTLIVSARTQSKVLTFGSHED